MKYTGSCHCGDVRFEVEGTIDSVTSCNCSICSRKGALLWFVPRDALQLETPDEKLSTYTFNSHVIRHRFCSRCGIGTFGEGADPAGNRMAAINVRCLDGVDIDALPVNQFDGKSL